MSKKRSDSDVFVGGQFYGRDRRGKLHTFGSEPPGGGEPDAWICRRVVDFPRGEVPPGGEVDQCSKCLALVVFNPARTVSAVKVCMQCAGIQPLPME